MSRLKHRDFSRLKNWVIKIGSSILMDATEKPDLLVFERLAADWLRIHESGRRVVLVSSGAIACGLHAFGFSKKPVRIPDKQAVAAVGQIRLMNLYESAFKKMGLGVAQILLTREDLSDPRRYLNVRHAIEVLLENNKVPIINENDSVAVDEIKFGDNDNLSALLTNVVEADLLIILTDQEGFYTADPRTNPQASVIPLIEDLSQDYWALAGNTSRPGSTGGMTTKLEAAEKAARFGVPTLIASGRRAGVFEEILNGKNTGTLILPKTDQDRLSRKKHRIAYMLKSRGQIFVDSGAKDMLALNHKSLLPSGIQKVSGNFDVGDPVDLLIEGEKPFARGLAGYSAREIEKIKGFKSSEIEKILGYKYLDEVVHCDDWVLVDAQDTIKP